MAQDVGTLAITLTANAAPLTAGLRAAQTQIANFGTVNVFKSAAPAAGGPLAAVVAGALLLKEGADAAAGAMGAVRDMTVAAGRAAFDLGSRAVQLAADYQDARTSFEVFTGSAEKGTKLLGQIQEFAAATPFESRDLIQQGRMLMGMGVTAENVLPSLRTLGEIASGMGGGAESVQRLSLAFGQVMAKGRLMGEEVLQFAEAGIGVKEFAKTAGVSVLQFQKNMEAGRVGADVMVNTFNRLTAPGGRFFGLMDKIGDNWNARVNNIRESVSLGLQDAGLAIIRGLQESGGLAAVQGQVEWFRAAAPGVGRSIGDAFARARPLVDAVGAGLVTVRGAMADIGALADRSGFFGLGADRFKELAVNGVGLLVTALGEAADAAVRFGGLAADYLFLPMLRFFQKATNGAARVLDAWAKLERAGGNLQGAKELRTAAGLLRDADPFFDIGIVNARAMARAGQRTNFAETWATRFLETMAGGRKEAEKAAEAVGKIKPPSLLPPEVAQRAMEVGKAFDAADPLKRYQDTFSATLRAGYMRTLDENGVRSNPLLNPGQVRFGLAEAFRELEKSLGDTLAKVPAAVTAGSVEAQRAINLAQVDADKNNPIRRVADTLARAERLQREQVQETRRLADAILRSRVSGRGI